MKREITVPAMGESISEAIIGLILKPSGSSVLLDDEVLELETDKVNQVLYAPQQGTLTLTVKQGDVVKIGQTIGFVDFAEQTAAKPAVPAKKIEEPQNGVKEGSPGKGSPDRGNASLGKKELAGAAATKQTVEPQEKKQELPKSPPSPPQQAVDVRKKKEDFIADITSEAPKAQSKEKAPVAIPSSSDRVETHRKMSQIRKVIAQRLVEAQQTAAMLTTFNEVDMSQVMALREKFKDSFMKKHGVKLGLMSFFVKATVAALQVSPDLNSYIQGEDIVHREYFDIGIAVGTDKGVIVPVIRGCDRLSFAGIEKSIESFATKAKEGSLSIADLQGGGFTITNGGTYGSLLSTPILTPPQSGILGMHKIEQRAVVINNEVAIRPMMYVALSYDHRIVDGKEAVLFLVTLKHVLEDPSRLLLDL